MTLVYYFLGHVHCSVSVVADDCVLASAVTVDDIAAVCRHHYIVGTAN